MLLTPSSRYGAGVTTSRFAQLVTRWLSGREPGSGPDNCFTIASLPLHATVFVAVSQQEVRLA